MVKLQSRLFALVLVAFAMVTASGCGEEKNVVLKPDMSPEALQAQVERNAEAAKAGVEE
ncbi:hypothetical protein [Aporhodopirellula aestuarii]|uniref:Secreted protein n=1 Tax=Aporhodopirellula aestuarii TaxID=2950107 RepID=A0ABT0UCL0_9BACT|nr:hypothetical protein [Aporhodopirellula aestuarii]MCM2374773.1 hypothetical protein [Aporhodopirellula aestuarii]